MNLPGTADNNVLTYLYCAVSASLRHSVEPGAVDCEEKRTEK